MWTTDCYISTNDIITVDVDKDIASGNPQGNLESDNKTNGGLIFKLPSWC
jgi:hypothetical protein